MIKRLEDEIISILQEYRHSGLSEEHLFNYITGKVGTVEKPLNLDDYNMARANLNDRLVEREVVFKFSYGYELIVKRLFLREYVFDE